MLNTGTDQYGKYAEFTFGDVTQRMRWIPPGRFMMGSPENEEGRWGNEGPQHEVTLTQGYWLFDTPVTQALWTAVMGENPSCFKSPDRPVENFSYASIGQFLSRLNDLISELDLALPSEAQWEYACRAGTKMPTYADATEKLSDIAWFSENSDGRTQPVAKKRCNAWGLYDMLGNVWEWCADDMRTYGGAPVADPVGSLKSAQRALRGGSWFNDARLVRAALRGAYDRGRRYDRFGFRCARVRE